MKRIGNLYSKIWDMDNLENAANKTLAGKKKNKARQIFCENREYYLKEILKMLIDKTYILGNPMHSFKVYEPKERIIHCPPYYPDRIIHHALMNIIVKHMIKKFNGDAYGSIKGRGIAMAAKKIYKWLKLHPNHYFLQVDIHHFYESINHDSIKNEVRTIFKCKDTLQLIDSVIDCHNPGLSIGSYPNQYLANVMLYRLDRKIKEILKIKFYVRYMDDMLFIVESKEKAWEIKRFLDEELSKFKLHLKK